MKRKLKMSRQAQLAILLLAATLVAVAQDSNSRVFKVKNGEWIEEINGTLPAGKMVKVKTTSGPIRINGARQDSITFTVRKFVRAASENAARREFASLRFSTRNVGGVSFFRGECGVRGYVSFDLNVPVQTSFVRLETSGGTINARNISGRVEAVTGGESIQLDGIGAGVYAASGGGNIEIGTVGGDVQVETGGGSIHIGSAGGHIIASSRGGGLVIGAGKNMTLNTGAGPIQVKKCDGPIKATTGGGSIDLSEVAGPAQLESGGGSIHAGPVHGGLRVDTRSGPIVVYLAKGSGALTDSRLETAEGDIVVYIPADLGLTIRAAVEMARGAGIRSDFAGMTISAASQQWGPHDVFAEGVLNGGGPLLHVHTTNGTIEFKRQNGK